MSTQINRDVFSGFDEDHDRNPITPESIIKFSLDYARRREAITQEEADTARRAFNRLLGCARLVVQNDVRPTNINPVIESLQTLQVFEGKV